MFTSYFQFDFQGFQSIIFYQTQQFQRGRINIKPQKSGVISGMQLLLIIVNYTRKYNIKKFSIVEVFNIIVVFIW